jgi:hypothetical protein
MIKQKRSVGETRAGTNSADGDVLRRTKCEAKSTISATAEK